MIDIKLCDCLDLQSKDVDLVYLDPPYGSKQEDTYYGVGETFDEYLQYMKTRLQKMNTWMKSDSNIVVHVDWKACHYLKVIGDEIFGRENFRNHIVWCYSSPSVAKSQLPRKHDDLLWWGKGNYTFNIERIPYNKLSKGGKTSWSGKELDVDKYLAKGMLLQDYWLDIPSLCRNEGEKTGYATQKPLNLLKRIISLFSNDGDLVCDPFCGSGTTAEAAMMLNRNFIGCDRNEVAVDLIRKRLGEKSVPISWK